MKQKKVNQDPSIKAFALGGLAGGNGFGAGFLCAMQEAGIRPATISCTSGMIVWTLRFLRGQDLRTKFMEEWSATLTGQGVPDTVASSLLAMRGLPGVFRPALPEYFKRWLQWPLPSDARGWADRLYPVQVAVPTRDPDFFAEAATYLEASDVSVLFNAFCPHRGEEYVFANRVAMERLKRVPGDARGNRRYLPICAEAIEAALHLYSYGYENTYLGEYLVDGAYHRQFILDELAELPFPHKPDEIWAVRPQNTRWIGEMPKNYFQQRDLETEIGMNSSYAQQVARLRWVNSMLTSGELRSQRYACIDLKEIEYPMQRGYFNYFNESPEVFNTGYGMGRSELRQVTALQP
jgi:hypothetical protein